MPYQANPVASPVLFMTTIHPDGVCIHPDGTFRTPDDVDCKASRQWIAEGEGNFRAVVA